MTSFKYETSNIKTPSFKRIFLTPKAKSFKFGTCAKTLLAVMILNSLYFFLKKKHAEKKRKDQIVEEGKKLVVEPERSSREAVAEY